MSAANHNSEDALLKKIKIISASAGSGKTYRLTHEITDAIVKDGVDPRRILATTFTRKAAAELAERARTTLLQAGRSADAEHLAAARIGTVNAVCGQIASDYAFELGLSPHADVLDQQRASVAFKRCLAEVMTRAERERLNDIGRRFEEFDYKEDIRRITEHTRTNGIAPESLAACAAQAWSQLEGIIGPIDPTIDHDQTLLDALDDAFARAKTLIENRGYGWKGVRTALSTYKYLRRNLSAGRLKWKDWIKAKALPKSDVVRDFFSDVCTAAECFGSHPKFHADLKDAITLGYDIAARALAAYQRYKQARRAVDFIDQETLALRLLNDEKTSARIAADIDIVFVDEFQDTSPLQLAIFLKLATIAKRSVWVGDQKQAIFGFRGTDPALMDATVEAVERVARVNIATLGKSYRSRPALVDSTSALFAKPFERQHIGQDRVVLMPHLAERPQLGPAYERWVLTADKTQATTAACLANALSEMLADPTATVYDDGATGARPTQPADVAILCRRHRVCAKVAAALAARGIGVAMAQSGLLKTAEGIAATAALRLWADPGNTLAAAELVRLFRYPEDAAGFVQHALAARTAHGDEADARSYTPSPLLSADVVQRVTRAREEYPLASGVEAFDRVIEAIDLREYCLSWGNSDMRLANLDAMRGHMVTFAESALQDGASTSPAAQWAQLKVLEETEDDTQAVLGRENAVNVLTWHAAKGLEWPVTVLYELERDRTSAAWGVSSDLQAGTELDFRAPLQSRWVRYWPHPFHRGNKKSSVHEALEQSDAHLHAEARREREDLRLLYVGWTRAKDRLVLAAAEDDIEQGILRTLVDKDGEPVFCDVDDAARGGAFPVATTVWNGHEVTMTVRRTDDAPKPKADATPDAGYVASGPRLHPPAFQRPSDTSGVSEVSATLTLGPPLASQKRRSNKEAQRFGTALHDFLAVDAVALGAPSPPTTDERRQLARALFERYAHASDGTDAAALDAYAEDALAASERLRKFCDERWPGTADYPTKWRAEWPVWHPLPSGSVVRGSIDLVLDTPEGFVVIDHKTFSGSLESAPEKAATFAGQLGAYASAIEAATRRDVIGRFVHMPLHGAFFAVGGAVPDVFARSAPAPVTPHKPERRARPLTSAQVPQADSPQTLLAVLRADVAGADYDGVSSRQLDYYRAAARLFGLTDAQGALTDRGRGVIAATTDADAIALCAEGFAASACAEAWFAWAGVDDVRDVDASSAAAFIEEAVGLAASTAKRRASTLRGWLSALLSPGGRAPHTPRPKPTPSKVDDADFASKDWYQAVLPPAENLNEKQTAGRLESKSMRQGQPPSHAARERKTSMSGAFEYPAIEVIQQTGSPPFYLGAASAKQLLEWCDVPRAKGDYMAGYQRTLNQVRATKLTKYLEISPKNIVPGAIIIAIDEDYVDIKRNEDGTVRLVVQRDERDFQQQLEELFGLFSSRLSSEELDSANIGFTADDWDDEDDDDGDGNPGSEHPSSYLASLAKELNQALLEWDSLNGG